MTYEEAQNFIKEKLSLGVKPGLDRIKSELESFGNPQDAFKTVHVAGTNGKGTVAASVADSLSKAGFKTGLLTSPWVVDYREQIQLDGEYISKSDFAKYAKQLKAKNSPCTEFECLCVIAYNYFRDNNADFAVIECGMGGREDATNVEKKNLSVITSISLDHIKFLGDTVDKIAEEKSGILRAGCTCVLYNEELKNHFENKCSKLVTGGLNDNLSLVNAALSELKIPPRTALKALPARQERIGNILLDGSHNPSAAKMLAPKLDGEVAVIGMMKDKNIELYLKIIAPKCKKIIATQPSNPRSASPEFIAGIARKYCDNVSVVKNPSSAVKTPGVTLVCGSFYLARDVRKILLDL